jgi:homoaconitase/3-isopropylmalate dehydratase large subunit
MVAGSAGRQVVLKGNLSPGVTGKDVIIALCGLFNKDEVLNHAVEFVGDGVANLPMSARMTIANMTTEWGALAGVFPFDEVTVNYLRSRVPEFTNPKRPGTRGPKSRSGYTNADIDEWWKIEANSAPTRTRNTRSSSNWILPRWFRTCPGLTK